MRWSNCANVTWSMKSAKKIRGKVLGIGCLRSMVGVTRMDKVMNEDVHRSGNKKNVRG